MGTFTLFQQGITAALTADTAAYTMGVQFSVSGPGTLAATWFYSASGAVNLPDHITLFRVSDGFQLARQAAAWSGAVGSGWVRAAWPAPPVLAAGVAYKACIESTGGANFYSSIAHYWDSGAGQNGISNGPLSAPNNAGGDHGQDTFFAGTPPNYPTSSFNATNYMIDPEVNVVLGGDDGGYSLLALMGVL